MVRPIYAYGSAVLRRKAEEIEKGYEGLEELISDMFDTMQKAEGVGLAAPQIGVSKRLFMIDASPMAEDNPELLEFKKVFINAVIKEQSGEEWSYNEGCLSVPGIREDIIRKPEIVIEYDDENFVHHVEKFSGIQARIIQHEYDHIEGMIFVDHASAIRKRFLRGKLAAVSKGKVTVNYKMKFPG